MASMLPILIDLLQVLLFLHLSLDRERHFSAPDFSPPWTVFPRRAFPHRAFQHRIMKKINPRHTLTLTQPKIYFSCLPQRRETEAQATPAGRANACSEMMHPLGNSPRHPRPADLMRVVP